MNMKILTLYNKLKIKKTFRVKIHNDIINANLIIYFILNRY